MKTITLSGIIATEYFDGWHKIKLVQGDGYKIDLVSRFTEAIETYGGAKLHFNYWISDKPCSKEEMLEGWLKKLHGTVGVGYEANSYAYSEYSSGTDYDTNLTIGGHDLYAELNCKIGKFIMIEMNFTERK